ncbi:MAG: BatA domain-containing protein [Gemmatimonadaceae bacterium]
MLSFFAPGYLLAALAAAGALVAAHFIVRRQPRALTLPTARFVPDAPVLTTGWDRRPSDLLVLALRVLCVLLAGLALAGPSLRERAGGSVKLILADRSRAVADSAELRDSIAAVRADDDVVLDYGAGAAGPGSLSAGLVAATRAASRFRGGADSVELVIVSSFAAEELDAATARVRREWPGRARLVRVAAPAIAVSMRSPVLVSEAADPLAVALAMARPLSRADVRIVRGQLGAADSLWAGEQPSRVLLHWPVSTAPDGFIARAAPDSIGAVVARGEAIISPFQRRWQLVSAIDRNAVAWWSDGDAAAAESALGSGCVRSVAIPVSAAGDFVLRPDLHALIRELAQPCGGALAYEPFAPASIAMLAGTGGLAPSAAFAKPPAEISPAAKWLLLGSLLCALLELLARRRRGRELVTDSREADPIPSRKVA